MSKIGKLPIAIPDGVTVTITGSTVNVQAPNGASSYVLPKGISAEIVDAKLQLSQVDTTTGALYGLSRANIANIITGLTKGFEKKLELAGVGYRAQVSGTELTLSVGFSHPVKMQAPQGITFAVAEGIITVSGADKTIVGNVAANIRKVRPPEPYKGKGIKYVGEHIRRKAGKAAKAVGAAK